MNDKKCRVNGVMSPGVVKVFIFICLLALCPASLSSADDHEVSNRLIQAYVQAVKADDSAFIKSTWNAVNSDQETLHYMRRTMPRLDYLFRVRGLYLQLQELQSNRPEFFGGQNSSLSVGSSVETLKSDLSSKIAQEVAKFSLSEPYNNARRTNLDIVQAAQGRSLIDNREIVLANPNQNRIDNVDYVQSRADFMFSRKFQKAPAELVPRGDSFPKTRSSPNADLHIQGFSTVATFYKISRLDQSLDISLNGRMIAHDRLLTNALATVNLYLETGMNILNVYRGDHSDKSGTAFVVSFEGALTGEKEFTFGLQPGQSFVLRIEAAP